MSSPFLRKSDENFEAAKLLLDKRIFAPSVHCAYYCVLQVLYHIVIQCLDFSLAKMDDEMKRFKSGSHVFVRQKVEYYIRNTIRDPRKAMEFKRNFKELEQKRIEADYKGLVMQMDDCYSSIEKADRLKDFLKETIQYEDC